jgi:hypothetical protein
VRRLLVALNQEALVETVPEEYLDAGDHVVVEVPYSGRGRGSEIEFDDRLFDV